MAVFFTSDTHFGHHNIRKLANRNYASVDDMDRALILRWNSVVSNKDAIYCLGDFAYKSDPTNYFKHLNGEKHLIVGNHDGPVTLGLGWDSVQDYKEIEVGDYSFVLCHYPFEEWNGFYKGHLHLHGHQHNKDPHTAPRRLDVGVDGHKYQPWSVNDVVELLAPTHKGN